MAFFSRLLGGGGSSQPKPRAAPQPQVSATERLSQTTETLDKRLKVLDKQIEQQETQAKDFLKKKNQKQAMQCLKRKKMYEEQRTKLENQRLNMEQLLIATSESNTLIDVVNTQRQVQAELARNMPSIEVVEDTTEKLQDQMDQQREISEMLGQPMAGMDIDEDDLLAELEGMQDELDEEFESSLMPDIGTKNLPDPNQEKKDAAPAQAVEEDEDDILDSLREGLNA